MTTIIEDIQADIDTYITGLSTSTTVEEMMAIVAAIDASSMNRIVKLDLISDLPEAYNIPSGSIFFVKEINTLVFSSYDRWLGLDGRILRIDQVTLLTWGCNSAGRLGDDTEVARSSPVTVVGGITGWTLTSEGANNIHSMGIKYPGIIYSWGNNTNGRLGDNTTIARSSPVTVVGGITNWSKVSAGNGHSLGIAGGIAYGWGSNTNGQLGNNFTTSYSFPISVSGNITNWSQVSAGNFHSLGIANGIAYSWGNNTNGMLGDNSTSNRSSPVTVVGNITNWSQVSAGAIHSLGIAGGIAYTWGANDRGQLGDSTSLSSSKSSPVTVIGGITNWSQVSAGALHNLGLTSDGVLYAWGYGGLGRLGNNSTTNRSSPVTVVGGITNWSQVSAGGSHNAGLAGDVAYAWGYNGSGRLGDNTTTNASSPVTIVGGITNWIYINANSTVTLGLKTD